MNLVIKKKVVDWIKQYAANNNIETLVVGVSGGIDSAVVSALCASTGLPTRVLNLPINSKQENTNLSTLQCDWLTSRYGNVSKYCVDLTEAYNKFESTMNTFNFSNDLATANSKSRMRMMCLYYVAAAHDGMVVGTGNKVEDFGVGFFTKYGDGGVDISPIADFTKTQVRSLARLLEIPEDIIKATPTDGLWEDSRSDEEQIGASYEELEWAMQASGEPQTEREKEVIKIYNTFHRKNKHKMVSIPVFKLSEG
jgi:NAD+ synthase